MMRAIATLLVIVPWVSGCSSVSLPTMPSLSWSSAPKADPTAEALFDDGMRAFNEKRYVRALDNFSKLRTDFPFSPQVTQVELKIADAYYLNQQYPEAINAFKEFQSMHPTNENIPFVILRLGQSYFDQFTSTDRDQKNTEIAKGYFENVISAYPKSPHAVEAKEKLAKCLEYLAEHEFTVAQFYFQQEKYPAARDRFEEIVRKYKDTPTAIKSLYFLGESYRNEKNAVRATLAYEALIQHYPQSKFAADAKTQLAQIEKEKRDPLAMLLMRDRRPSGASAPEVKEDPALAKVKNLNLIAKKDVVYEEPGAEKGFLRRVADKLNPFSSDDNAKKEEQKDDTTVEQLAKRNQAQKKDESSGVLAALWPFGGKDVKASAPDSGPKKNNLVGQIDDSLKQKGIDSASSQAALKPPPADLPKTDDMNKTVKTMDTAVLLGSIDANLKKSGKDASELPPPPEPAAGFKDTAVQAMVAKAATQNEPPKDVQSSGILSSIDQKLKAQGVDAGKFEKPPTTEELKAAAAAQKSPVNPATKVELEPKLTLEKGPLYLSPVEVEAQDKSAAKTAPSAPPPDNDAPQEIPSRVLVKGPIQPQVASAATRPAESKPSSANQDDEPKGALDQIRQDMDSVSKALNPFRW